MSSESPVATLYSSDGYELNVQNNTVTPAGTRGLLVAGTDGSNSRIILMDGSSRQIVAGAGVAGTPAGGVITIQGVTSGTAVSVSGTVTANQGTANTLSNKWPVQITDGTNTMPTGDTVGRAIFKKITDGTNTAAVKAASTVAALTDPSLVVAISPNEPMANGSISALNGTLSISTQGMSNVGIAITGGAWSATIIFEVTVDGANWFPVVATPIPITSTTVGATTTITSGIFTAPVSGANQFRVRASAYTSGSVGVSLEANKGSATVAGLITVQQGTAANLLANIGGLGASGSAATGNPVLLGGKNQSGNAQTLITDALGSLIISRGANQFSVQNNATVTTSGSQIITTNNFGDQQIILLINITASPTGTLPTITYSLQEVDPGNGTTVQGNVSYTPSISASGTYFITLFTTTSNLVKASWVVTGTTPSFTGVYATVVTKSTSGNIYPSGAAHTQQDPVQQFYEDWSSGSTDSNKWAGFGSGGGTFSVTAGSATIGSGTTASGYAELNSVPLFLPSSPGWIHLNFNIAIENPVLTNAYRFWGLGIVNALPSTASPLTDAVGFEVTTTGKMFAVTYASLTRNAIQDLSASTGNGKQPTNASGHDYTIQFRGDKIVWLIDDFIVAQINNGALGPNINLLPITNIAIAGATPPSSSANITNNASYLSITNAGSIAISDGAYGFRKATVKAASTAAAATDSALVVAVSPNNSVLTGQDVTASGTLNALNSSVQINLSGLQSVGFQIPTASNTLSATIVAELSMDGGTTWNATYLNSFNQFSALSLGVSSTAIAGSIVTVGGAGLARIRVSAFTSGSATITLRATYSVEAPDLNSATAGGTLPPVVQQVGGNTSSSVPSISAGTINALTLNTLGALRVETTQTSKATYVAVARQVIPTSANPTDLFTIYGSGSKTVRVLRMWWSATQGTAAIQEVDVIKRSATNTGGTSASATAVPCDSNFSAATATVLSYTVNPTGLGASVGFVRSIKAFVNATGSTIATNEYIFDFSHDGTSPGVVLRGTSQGLAINWGNGAAVTTSLNINMAVEWTEE